MGEWSMGEQRIESDDRTRDQTLGVYVSVPFCRAKCTYCNFASGVHGVEQHARYVERVCAELRGAEQSAERLGAVLPRTVGSVYLGGGTPSLLAPELLRRIFDELGGDEQRSGFSVAKDVEITVECAPGQMADEFLKVMVEVGVTRVSLGVQSFVDAEARATGRSHTREGVLEEIARLRRAGIRQVNVDLIAGLPGQTLESWRESLKVLAESGAAHASVYMLEVDEDSRLGRELIGGGARYGAGLVPVDDAIAAMYEEGCAALAESGIVQYEISNFARPGAESRHNLRYWRRQPYLGVGLDAHSMLRREDGGSLRFGNTDDLDAYLGGDAGANGEVEVDVLTRADELEEAWFLGLRLNAGVSRDALVAEFGAVALGRFDGVLEELCGEGLLMLAGDRVALTDRGRMLSNEVFARFLSEEQGQEQEGEREPLVRAGC
jgi:oxygen-independent coproporphyrinogen-3 oxidase